MKILTLLLVTSLSLSAQTANKIIGANGNGTGYEEKGFVAGSGVTITHAVGTITISCTGGGGGLPNYVSVKRTADTTNSIATPVNVGGMAFTLTSGTYYKFRFVLIYSTAALTTGIKVSLTTPATTAFSSGVSIFGQAADGATTEPWDGTINSSGDVVTSTAVAVINVPYLCIIDGVILPSANGVLQLKWSPEVAAAATLKQGSMAEIWSY